MSMWQSIRLANWIRIESHSSIGRECKRKAKERDEVGGGGEGGKIDTKETQIPIMIVLILFV